MVLCDASYTYQLLLSTQMDQSEMWDGLLFIMLNYEKAKHPLGKASIKKNIYFHGIFHNKFFLWKPSLSLNQI